MGCTAKVRQTFGGFWPTGTAAAGPIQAPEPEGGGGSRLVPQARRRSRLAFTLASPEAMGGELQTTRERLGKHYGLEAIAAFAARKDAGRSATSATKKESAGTMAHIAHQKRREVRRRVGKRGKAWAVAGRKRGQYQYYVALWSLRKVFTRINRVDTMNRMS